MSRTIRSSHALLWVNLLVYIPFGLVALVAPDWLGGELGIELTSATAFADFRAIYGGIPLGVGLCLAVGLSRRDWLRPMVALAGACALEAAASRAYSWIASGTPSALIFAFMATELLCSVWALQCYRALSAAADRRQAANLHAASA